MKISIIISISAIFFISGCSIDQEARIQQEIATFRDNPHFYQTIRGLSYNVASPTPENIQSTINGFDKVYHEYLQELMKGFIAELEGNYIQAKNHYENCIKVPIHEEQSYYTHLDLARLSLKLGAFSEAKKHFKIYLSAMKREISAGDGELTDIFFGYAPSGESLNEMKVNYKKLTNVYEQLEKAF